MDLASAAAEARARPPMPKPPSARRREPRRTWLRIVFVAVLFVVFWRFDDHSSRTEEIDIQTGRFRAYGSRADGSRFADISDTVISRLVPPHPGTVPQWHRVASPPPLKYTLHTVPTFSGVKGSLAQLERSLQWETFTDDARRHVATEVLRLWQAHESPYPAPNYVFRVERARQRAAAHDPPKLITRGDLPPASDETSRGTP